ncbi:MAG: hypothetical protein DWI58_14220 [Chloroflexi bacterium]|nr:MAG: hypothetical protein DWI58_14220 [Chloroflexota bacterium]
MNPFRSMSKKRALPVMAIVAMALVACEAGPFCNANDSAFSDEADLKSSEQVLGKTPTPTTTATTASTATAAVSTTSTPVPTGTAAGTGTAAAGQAIRLRGALGVDHPPFTKDWGVQGRSIGLACLSGIPTNGLVTMTIGGTAGAPPTITGSGTGDGTVIIAFPIQQFGTMSGAITSLRVNGQPAGFTADPFAYTVDAPDLICTAPR